MSNFGMINEPDEPPRLSVCLVPLVLCSGTKLCRTCLSSLRGSTDESHPFLSVLCFRVTTSVMGVGSARILAIVLGSGKSGCESNNTLSYPFSPCLSCSYCLRASSFARNLLPLATSSFSFPSSGPQALDSTFKQSCNFLLLLSNNLRSHTSLS